MALQGTLDTFALADVLRLLAATTKTGELRIDGERGPGSVWLADGAVVGGEAAVATESTVDVVFELLRNGEGSFEFVADDTVDGHQPQSVDEVVDQAEAKLEEWRGIEQVVPSLFREVTLASDLPEAEVLFDQHRWHTIMAIGEGRSVGAVGERLGLGEIAVSKAVKALVDDGMAVIGDDVETTEATFGPPVESEEAFDPAVGARDTDDEWEDAIEDQAGDLGASEQLDGVVRAELTEGAGVESFDGSHAVALDASLDTDDPDHSYLTVSDGPVDDRPEPLPTDEPVEVASHPDEAAPALDSDPFLHAPTLEQAPVTGPDDELEDDADAVRQLATMSPRAAKAISAASATDTEPDADDGDEATAEELESEQPMNRGLLMKFISSK